MSPNLNLILNLNHIAATMIHLTTQNPISIAVMTCLNHFSNLSHKQPTSKSTNLSNLLHSSDNVSLEPILLRLIQLLPRMPIRHPNSLQRRRPSPL